MSFCEGKENLGRVDEGGGHPWAKAWVTEQMGRAEASLDQRQKCSSTRYIDEKRHIASTETGFPKVFWGQFYALPNWCYQGGSPEMHSSRELESNLLEKKPEGRLASTWSYALLAVFSDLLNDSPAPRKGWWASPPKTLKQRDRGDVAT